MNAYENHIMSTNRLAVISFHLDLKREHKSLGKTLAAHKNFQYKGWFHSYPLYHIIPTLYDRMIRICRPSPNLFVRLVSWSLECSLPLGRLASEFHQISGNNAQASPMMGILYMKIPHWRCYVHICHYTDPYSYPKYLCRAFSEGNLYVLRVWGYGGKLVVRTRAS